VCFPPKVGGVCVRMSADAVPGAAEAWAAAWDPGAAMDCAAIFRLQDLLGRYIRVYKFPDPQDSQKVRKN